MHGIGSVLDPLHFKRVETIWRELELECGLAGIKITPLPHFTWQIAENYDIDRLLPELRAIADQLIPISIQATGLGVFTGEQPVIYIPLVRDSTLTAIHQQLWDRLSGMSSGLHPYYSPPLWMPHITLAYGDVDRQKLACLMQKLAFQDLNMEIRIDNLLVVYQFNDQFAPMKERLSFSGSD